MMNARRRVRLQRWIKTNMFGVKRRIVSIYGVFLFAFVLTAASTGVMTQRDLINSDLQERVEVYNNVLVNFSQTYVPELQIDNLGVAVDGFLSQPNITFAQIVAPDGLVLTAGSAKDADSFLNIVDDPLVQDVAQSGVPSFTSERRMRTYITPVLLGAEVIAVARFGLDMRPYQAELRHVGLQSLSVGVLFLVLGFILSERIGSYIARPLKALTRATERIAEGDLEAPILIEANDEAGALSTSFAKMVKQLNLSVARSDRLAYVDGLTGLSNREWFLQRLAVSSQNDKSLGLLFIDLDNFKKINDRLGHAVGDDVLRAFARRLTKAVEAQGFILDKRDMPVGVPWSKTATAAIARLAGDEFTVILRHASFEDCRMVAEAIIDLGFSPFEIADEKILTTSSIGFAVAPANADTDADLLKFADIAMYGAKARGRNAVAAFDKDIYDSFIAEQILEEEFRTALAEKQLEVFYQPKVASANLCVQSAEALVRWIKPDGRMVSPGAFIPLAERMNLMGDLGLIVAEKAFRDAKEWPLVNGAVLTLAVNMSAEEISDRKHVIAFVALMDKCGFDPLNLEVEITESSAMAQLDVVQDNIALLRSRNIKLSVDDFGTGFSNLDRLGKMKFDTLKIDKSLIDNICQDTSARALLVATIGIADALRMDVVAEGVEAPEQTHLLKKLGCHSLQGFVFSKPLPQDQFLEFVTPDSVRNTQSA